MIVISILPADQVSQVQIMTLWTERACGHKSEAVPDDSVKFQENIVIQSYFIVQPQSPMREKYQRRK